MNYKKKKYTNFQVGFVAGCGACALIIAIVFAVAPLPEDQHFLVVIFKMLTLLFVNGSKALPKQKTSRKQSKR